MIDRNIELLEHIIKYRNEIDKTIDYFGRFIENLESYE